MKIIPWPVSVQENPGHVSLPSCISIGFSEERLKGVASYLGEQLQQKLRFTPSIQPLVDPSNDTSPQIVLSLEPCPALSGMRHREEGYELEVTEKQISITGEECHGVFNGIQTLMQLLPPTVPEDSVITVPCAKIVDAPRFMWRGALLDVGRHFFDVKAILTFIDILAMHKCNRFHWHLVEDQEVNQRLRFSKRGDESQGWRLEIKSFPKLTEFGAWRESGEERYGGFYAQDEVRYVVAYAKERFIEVVPEIELPGHCGAALACYPHLSCSGSIRSVPTSWGVHAQVYCGGNEATFQFLEGVLKEVVELFPYEYIHIGGDECPKTAWAQCSRCQAVISENHLEDENHLQTWFVERVAAFLATHKRKIIGWDEILEGGIPQGATVMAWRGSTDGVIAVKLGHDVIMTPCNFCYLDYRQSMRPEEPGAWYAVLPLQGCYAFDPIPATGERPALLPLGDDVLAGPRLPEVALPDGASMQPAAAECGGSSGSGGGGGGSESAAGMNGAADGEGMDTSGAADDMDTAQEGGAEMSSDSCGGAAPAAADEASSRRSEGGDGGGVGDAMEERECGSSGCGTAAAAAAAQPPEGFHGLPHMPGCATLHLTEEEQQRVLGAQANLWTEYVSDENTLFYMLLPRLAAFAESVWSPAQSKSWLGFMHRLQHHVQHYDALGYRYRPLDPDTAAPLHAAGPG